jgi:lipopolysaccharide assembly protein A
LFRFLKYLPLFILAALFAAFAIDNRGAVTLSLFPLPYTAELPAYLLVLLSVMLGAGMAALVAALTFLRRKFELTNAKRRIMALENEIGGLRAERAVLPPIK